MTPRLPKDAYSWCLLELARLEATQSGVRDGDFSVVTRRADPLRRRALHSRLLDAYQQTQALASHPTMLAFTARRAFLGHLGEEAALADDVETVSRRFAEIDETLGLATPPRFVLTIGLASLLSTAALVGLFFSLAPDYWLSAELDKPRADAFVVGGRPLPGTREQRTFFAERLPKLVLAVDNNRPGAHSIAATNLDAPTRRTYLEAELRAVSVEAATLFGDTIAQLIDKLWRTVFELMFAGQGAADDVYAETTSLNDAIARAGYGFQLDVAVLGGDADENTRVLLASFLVEWVERYQSGDTRVRAVRWRRLDKLSFDRALLGYTREDLDDARVLMDRIDAWMVQELLPALRPATPLRLVDEASPGAAGPWAEPLQRAAGEEWRREAATLGIDAEDLEELGRAIQARQQVIAEWNAVLSSRGVGVVAPESYEVDLDRYAAIKQALVPGQWSSLVSVQSTLESGTCARAYRSIRNRLARSVERHEVQHRLDFAHARRRELPDALAAHVGRPPAGEKADGLQDSANAELSAYLAELARSDSLIKTNLAMLSRSAFDRTQWGNAESYAAVVIFASLGRELGATAPPLVIDGDIDRAAVAALMRELVALPDTSLSQLTRKVWHDLYGEDLPALQIVTAESGT